MFEASEWVQDEQPEMTKDIFVELLWKEVQLFGKLSNQRRFAFLAIMENEITSANLHMQGKPNLNRIFLLPSRSKTNCKRLNTIR